MISNFHVKLGELLAEESSIAEEAAVASFKADGWQDDEVDTVLRVR